MSDSKCSSGCRDPAMDHLVCCRSCFRAKFAAGDSERASSVAPHRGKCQIGSVCRDKETTCEESSSSQLVVGDTIVYICSKHRQQILRGVFGEQSSVQESKKS